MNYVPHTQEDMQIMLDRIGCKSIDALFTDIPENCRYPDIKLPPPLSELEVMDELAAIAAKNSTAADGPWFLGGGAYRHFIPALVPALASRGEFMTAYTPYQAEASQGTLQVLFEYQSMISALFGLPVVNASHYDGSTALAEAVLMACHAHPRAAENGLSAATVLIPAGLNPSCKQVVETFASGPGLQLETWSGEPRAALADWLAQTPDATNSPQALAAFVVQWPDFHGDLWDITGLAEQIHAAGGLLIMHVDPHLCGLLQSPGSLGADIVSAEGQCLGIPLSFGGPGLGIMACTAALTRRMPGRIVGQANDAQGRRGFVLTLTAREQHIRREKAVSNICSNQGLMALSACMYLAALGPVGLRQVARLCWNYAHRAARLIDSLSGFSVPTHRNASNPGAPLFFKEFLVHCPVDASALVARVHRNTGIQAGLAIAPNSLLVAVTELNNHAQIDQLVAALAQAAEELA